MNLTSVDREKSVKRSRLLQQTKTETQKGWEKQENSVGNRRFLKVNYTYCVPGTVLGLAAAAAAAKSLQSCPTLCDPRDRSPPGSPVPGILQTRTLEWVAISFSNTWTWKVKMKSLSCVRLLATSWTAAHQASPSMGFSRQECWSGVPLPSLYWALSSVWIRVRPFSSLEKLPSKAMLIRILVLTLVCSVISGPQIAHLKRGRLHLRVHQALEARVQWRKLVLRYFWEKTIGRGLPDLCMR